MINDLFKIYVSTIMLLFFHCNFLRALLLFLVFLLFVVFLYLLSFSENEKFRFLLLERKKEKNN